MKLYHKVIHEPVEKLAESIMLKGLIPQVATAYKDLVPRNIRKKPVVWFTENYKLFEGEPCFMVDAGDLDKERLHHTAIVYEVDEKLDWWVYQGFIPSTLISRVIPSPICF